MLRQLSLLLGIFAFLTACVSKSSSKEYLVITIAEEQEAQTVRHFGASAAWWAQLVGQWPKQTIESMLDLLYGDNDGIKGIGLDLIRYNLGGGKKNAIVNDPLRRVETIEADKGDFDFRRDQAAIRVVDMVVERGAEVVVFANSPPARLTVSGAATGNGQQSNLRKGAERDFAQYLVNAAEYLRVSRNWPIVDISPINEPQWDWAPKNGQEGSHYSPEAAYRVVRALYEEIRARGLDYRISAPESGELKLPSNRRYIDLLLGDEELRLALGHYAAHSYWSSAEDRKAINHYLQKNYPGVELWMTEWTEMRGGKDLSMDAALVLAATIHEDMVYGNASSWQYWIAVSPYDYRDGLLYIDIPTKSFEVSKKLWALGHWSRFIDAGARRLATDESRPNQLLSSAYRNLDGSVVTVLVNLNQNEARKVEIVGSRSRFSAMDVYETSAAANLERMYRGAPKPLTIPAASVLTVRLN